MCSIHGELTNLKLVNASFFILTKNLCLQYNALMENFINESYFIENTATVEDGVKIYPNVFIYGKSVIKKGTVIYSNSFIYDSIIGENSEIKSCYIENSVIKDNVKIGPFAHIRPNSILEDGCKIGNFVEIKNSKLGKGTKASHLAYIGDCNIGENCNIGCGVIFVNYNGRVKNRTTVGDNCFIGSNSNIIAPIKISSGTYICAGTTLTKNTDEDDFVIGRVRETVKNKRAHEYLKDV